LPIDLEDKTYLTILALIFLAINILLSQQPKLLFVFFDLITLLKRMDSILGLQIFDFKEAFLLMQQEDKESKFNDFKKPALPKRKRDDTHSESSSSQESKKVKQDIESSESNSDSYSEKVREYNEYVETYRKVKGSLRWDSIATAEQKEQSPNIDADLEEEFSSFFEDAEDKTQALNDIKQYLMGEIKALKSELNPNKVPKEEKTPKDDSDQGGKPSGSSIGPSITEQVDNTNSGSSMEKNALSIKEYALLLFSIISSFVSEIIEIISSM